MRRPIILAALLVLGLAGLDQVRAALVVPNEIQQPGTQPGEVSNLESPNKCDNCHGGYNQAVEPWQVSQSTPSASPAVSALPLVGVERPAYQPPVLWHRMHRSPEPSRTGPACPRRPTATACRTRSTRWRASVRRWRRTVST